MTATGTGPTVGDGRVLVCLGPGGVGKTTMSAAAGVADALAGKRVVVLTVDPARRLADALGLDRTDGHGLGGGEALGNEPRPVEGPWPGELWAAMLDPVETLRTIVAEQAPADQAERVVTNPLFATISESLSGVNEYMAAERLLQLHHDSRFDRIIVDTPPSRHAVDFLDGPRRLVNFFDNRFYRAVLAPRGGLIGSINAAAQLVVRLTAKVVGADLVDDVIRLFADMEGLDEGFRARAAETEALLAGPDCSFALVTTARKEPVREARWIGENLHRRSLGVGTIIVNRLTPYAEVDPTATAGAGSGSGARALADNLRQLGALGRAERSLVDGLADDLGDERPEIVRVDERADPLRAIDDLVAVAATLRSSVRDG